MAARPTVGLLTAPVPLLFCFFRYLSDYLNVLPLGLLTRMVRTNDTLMALVPLLEDPPWVRRRNKQTEKRIGNVWTAVAPRDRLRLTQQDAQVMLGLIAHAVGNLARPTCCCSSAYVARSPAVQMGTV